jgi:hypothetical protein
MPKSRKARKMNKTKGKIRLKKSGKRTRRVGRKLRRKRKTVKQRRIRKTFRRVKKHTKRIRGGTDFGCTYIREIKEGLEESCDMISAFDAVMDSCRHINGQKDKLKEKLQTLRFENLREEKIKKEFIDFIDRAESSDTAKNIFNTFYQRKGEAIIENFEEKFNKSFKSRDIYDNNIKENVGSCLEEEDIEFYNSVLDDFKQKVKNNEPCPKNFMRLENGKCEQIYPDLQVEEDSPPPLLPRRARTSPPQYNLEEEDY